MKSFHFFIAGTCIGIASCAIFLGGDGTFPIIGALINLFAAHKLKQTIPNESNSIQR